MSWEPKYGDRVIVTLPDGHEIEGTYARTGWVEAGYRVTLDGAATVIYGDWTTIRPVDPPEPTTFGARVVDGQGKPFVRAYDDPYPWRPRGPFVKVAWSELARPITVIDADPSWGGAA